MIQQIYMDENGLATSLTDLYNCTLTCLTTILSVTDWSAE